MKEQTESLLFRLTDTMTGAGGGLIIALVLGGWLIIEVMKPGRVANITATVASIVIGVWLVSVLHMLFTNPTGLVLGYNLYGALIVVLVTVTIRVIRGRKDKPEPI